MRVILKTLLVSVAVLFAANAVNAKNPEDALIDKYDGKKGFEVVIIGQDMLQMVTQMPMGISKEQKKLYEQTDEMVGITYNGKTPTIESMYNEALELFEAETHTYTENVTDKDVVGKAYAVEEGEYITKINVVLKANKSLQIFVMKGKYDKESFNEAQKPQKKMF